MVKQNWPNYEIIFIAEILKVFSIIKIQKINA